MTSHSFLTALSPIEFRHDDPEDRLEGVRQVLHDHGQSNSPFSSCPMVHFARFQILDDLTPPMGDISLKSLKTKYLLFVADIDGQVDDFLDCLYRENADFVQAVWGRCLGYPDYRGAVFFRRYFRACSFEGALAYASFPASVAETLAALSRKNALADWIACHQGLDGAELQKAWRRDSDRLANPEVPSPGAF